ncbi:MAG: hypothetical protein NTZ09_04865, partial [Candidatus Hydrogenedentes bacterium]|nr:hypothetical protein [Candidatus Hydrogenedentota bacterium]
MLRRLLALLLVVSPLAALGEAPVAATAPEWVARDGVVMAGSWEPLLFRVRRDGVESYAPDAAQREAYTREHSPEMVSELKSLGVNFVMMHCYKGAGLEAERQSMSDAVAFSKLCHGEGLRVGVYNFSGAFLWEPFFKERPDARDWVLLDADGSMRTYGGAKYRYYWNRNHPDARDFYHGLVKFAVEQIQTDLLHFDNYEQGPGMDANSVERFRAYLRASFTPERLESAGVADVSEVVPPMAGPADSFLDRAWLDFHALSLADSYSDLAGYGRSLRPDVLVECNPGGVGERLNPMLDHGRLLQAGNAFWDESRRVGYKDGQLATRIRTYKVARAMNNMAFTYTTSPLEMAEAMAFNLDCLGCICWFEYGHVVKAPGVKEPLDPATGAFVKFFHDRRDLFRGAEVVADAAVLRSYPSHAFGGPDVGGRTMRVEQALIDLPTAFQIIHDHQLADLDKYRALVLAGCPALSDRHVEQIRGYVSRGGRLLIVGEAGTHNEWMEPRPAPAFDDLQDPARVLRVKPEDDVVAALAKMLDGRPMLTVSCDSMPGVYAEVTRQADRWLVHLVNYRPEPAKDVRVELNLG